MSKQTRETPGVIHVLNGRYALVALKVPLEDGTVPHVWGIGTTYLEDASSYGGEGDHTKQFSDDELTALCRWWLRKNPGLLAEVLTADQLRELKAVICEYREMAVKPEGGFSWTASANILESILSPKEG